MVNERSDEIRLKLSERFQLHLSTEKTETRNNLEQAYEKNGKRKSFVLLKSNEREMFLSDFSCFVRIDST